MRRRRIRYGEGGKVHAGMACERRLQLASERGVGGLEKHFDVTA